MYPRLLTMIQVDLARGCVTLQIKGCLTTNTYLALIPVIRRAHALPGNPRVTVDLSFARLVDPTATALLTTTCMTLISISTSQRIPVHLISTGSADNARHLVPETTPAYSLAS